MRVKIIFSFILVLTAIFIFLFFSCSIIPPINTTNELEITSPTESEINKDKWQENSKAETASDVETKTTMENNTSDQIKVLKPEPYQEIKSPLLIEGEARGTWYFEATFPIKLMDANGNLMATHYAQAQGEWMTEYFVPFAAQLKFKKPATDTGILVLEKNNPSGFTENDASIKIPVKFSKSEKIVEDADPQKGEYFVYAVLKSIDIQNNKITVEQLINEPNEKEISPEVVQVTVL